MFTWLVYIGLIKSVSFTRTHWSSFLYYKGRELFIGSTRDTEVGGSIGDRTKNYGI